MERTNSRRLKDDCIARMQPSRCNAFALFLHTIEIKLYHVASRVDVLDPKDSVLAPRWTVPDNDKTCRSSLCPSAAALAEHNHLGSLSGQDRFSQSVYGPRPYLSTFA